MKFKALALAVIIALAALIVPLSAQTAVSTTTLGAATTATGETITVASTTGMTAGGPATGVAVTNSGGATFLFVDLEQMRVMRVISSTQVQVQRGLAGFPAVHASGATVYFGPGTAYKSVDPPIGTCTPTGWAYSPWINVANGNMSVCSARADGEPFRVYTTNTRYVTYDSDPQ